MNNVININGKNYTRFKDMYIECDENGNPKNYSTSKKNEKGGTDCTIHVHCLKIKTVSKK